jgi:hypothetical protein
MSKHMFSGTISEKGISRLEQMKSAKERLNFKIKKYIVDICAKIQCNLVRHEKSTVILKILKFDS